MRGLGRRRRVYAVMRLDDIRQEIQLIHSIKFIRISYDEADKYPTINSFPLIIKDSRLKGGRSD